MIKFTLRGVHVPAHHLSPCQIQVALSPFTPSPPHQEFIRSYKIISGDAFRQALWHTTAEMSSNAHGGHILFVSNEWFAPAMGLLKSGPAVSPEAQTRPGGALCDGSESRRHYMANVNYATVCLVPKAGATGRRFIIDTSNFDGNVAPTAVVYALAQLGRRRRQVV